MSSTTIPENNNKINIKLYLLDPLSVIIKLAVLSNKPIGTKILIQNNTIYFQEPGPFQSFCRIILQSNKTDLQYMYNPIELACLQFLSKEAIKKYPKIKMLFSCAQEGIKKLIETYKNCSIIILCLNYYYAIINNHLEERNEGIFTKDTMTYLYTNELQTRLNQQWSEEKIKVILDLIMFLTKDNMAINNVKSIENIMETIDKNTETIISSF